MHSKLIHWICLGLVLGFVEATTAAAADSRLVGWWKLDETTGTVAVDSSPSGNNGTIQGTPQWVNGQINGALYFDGDGTYVELPIGALINSLTDCTIGVWVSWTGSTVDSDWQRIFEFGSSGNSYMFLSPGADSDGPMRFVIRTPLGGTEEVISATTALGRGWHHVAVTIDSDNSTMALHLDGGIVASGAMTANRLDYMGATFYNWLGRSPHETPKFKGWLDDFYIFNRVLSHEEIQALQAGGGLERGLASEPIPADQETDVSRDVTLRWTPGVFANEHDVYFGNNFDDVNNADAGSPLLIGAGRSAAAFAPGRLEFGRTYYWRVDEVDAPLGGTIVKGEVWSFTVEPYACALPAECITPTASSHAEGRGPERTIDGSGLDANDMHSTVLADMWQTA